MVKKKRAKACERPTKQKQARTARATPHDGETIVWAFGSMDQGGDWGWDTVTGAQWLNDILPKLRDFESMTWSEIKQAAGGRTKGTNSHTVSVEKLSQKAKNRLLEIHQDDVKDLFSLRLTGKRRIYGIRDRRALKLLWFDKDHTVYPVPK